MTLMIEVGTEVEERLRALATRSGLPVEEYVKAILERETQQDSWSGPRPLHQTLSPDEWAQAYIEFAGSHRTDTPVIPLDALRRENLYDDR